MVDLSSRSSRFGYSSCFSYLPSAPGTGVFSLPRVPPRVAMGSGYQGFSRPSSTRSSDVCGPEHFCRSATIEETKSVSSESFPHPLIGKLAAFFLRLSDSAGFLVCRVSDHSGMCRNPDHRGCQSYVTAVEPDCLNIDSVYDYT
jgi:hypothetical protein